MCGPTDNQKTVHSTTIIMFSELKKSASRKLKTTRSLLSYKENGE